MRIVHDALHKDTGSVNLVGIEFAGFDQNFDLRNRDASAGGRVGIEVARGLAIDEVAVGIALPRFNERDVSADAALKNVGVAVEVAVFLAIGDDGADAAAG